MACSLQVASSVIALWERSDWRISSQHSLVQGLGIISRRQQPQHVLAFLQVLWPVAGAAEAVACQALQDMRRVASEVQARLRAEQQEYESRRSTAADTVADAEAASQDAARQFFESYHQQNGTATPMDFSGKLFLAWPAPWS
jgi:hypothetical protein